MITVGLSLPVNSLIQDSFKPSSIIPYKALAVYNKTSFYSNFSKYTLIVAPTEPVPLNLNTTLDLKLFIL